MLLAIDPGADTGWSLFDEPGRLVACGLGDPRDSGHVRAAKIRKLIVERPHQHGRARPKDLITLALRAGRWAGVFGFKDEDVDYIEPMVWKGTRNKDQTKPLILAKLAPYEEVIVKQAIATGGPKGRAMAEGKQHNMLDGIGIGLHGVGRGMRS